MASPSNSTADDATDSDGDAFGLIDGITGVAGVNDSTLDMGFTPTQELSGGLWDDSDGDGQVDEGETVHADVLVELFTGDVKPITDANGEAVLNLTDRNGSYGFEVTPGDYRMKLTEPDGTPVSMGDAVDEEGFTDVITVVLGVDITNANFDVVLPQTDSSDGTVDPVTTDNNVDSDTTDIPLLAFTGLSSNFLLLMALALLVTGSGTLVTMRGLVRRRES